LSTWAKQAARLRVTAGFGVAALYLVFSDPAAGSLAAAMPVALAGLALRTWAAGHLNKNRRLACFGPFAYTRNPLYLGSLLVAAGFACAARNPWLGAALGVYFAAFFLPVIHEEESHLRTLFPDYVAYARQVRRFVPRLTPAYRGGRFRWSLWQQNQEYQAVAAFLAGVAWLLLRLP